MAGAVAAACKQSCPVRAQRGRAARAQRPQRASRARCLSSSSSAFCSSLALPNAAPARQEAARLRFRVVAGNAGASGPFAPLVGVVRSAMGVKEFNQFRGKMISLHSQVIKNFCQQIGADTKQVQGLIRLAKKNGEKLGFLA